MPKRDSKPTKPGILRWLTVGFACYLGWMALNLVFALLFPMLFLIELVAGTAGHRFLRYFCSRFLYAFSIRYFSLIRLLRICELPDPKLLATHNNSVFISNHRSQLDALLLVALIPNVHIPVNATYTRIPLLGRLILQIGCIPFDRRSRQSVSKGAKKLRQAIQSGVPVAIFPEGTRSMVGQFKPFKEMFFKIIIDEKVNVVPLIIHLNYPFLSPKRKHLLTARRADLRIRPLETIVPQKGENGVELGRRVQKIMENELIKLDNL